MRMIHGLKVFLRICFPPKSARPASHDRMHCSICAQVMHRGEKFVIEGVHHRDCGDTKSRGQGNLFTPGPLTVWDRQPPDEGRDMEIPV